MSKSDIDSGKLFRAQLAQGLGMVSLNHYSGMVNMQSKSALPPSDFKDVNTKDYRKQFRNSPVLPWGEDNLFPTNIDKEAMASSVLEGGMKVYCDHLRGQSHFLYLEKFENGQRIIEEVDDQEVMDELEDIGYYEYWDDYCGELPKWANAWPLFHMNRKRDIALIRLIDGPQNRFERPHPTNGKMQNIYISAQWENGIDKKFTDGEIPKNLKPWIFKYPLLDRYLYADQLETLRNEKVFAYHLKYPTSGFKYGRAPWHSLYLNRWLGISGKVPAMMMRYYEVAMTINYLIYIDQDWLLKKFPGFEEWTEDKRQEKIKQIQDDFEKNLKGTDNAMKSLMLAFRIDSQSGKEVKNVIFEPLDNKMREGTHIPDSQVSDGQILFTLGLAPALMGAVIPGSKGGESGSGSNIREASLAMQMRMRPDRERGHYAFYIWRDYKFRDSKDRNKRRLKIGTRDYVINTLDQRALNSAQETTPAN
jgi:hypothetical protein